VVEIRDSIESYCQGVQYAQFMNALVPAFLKILDGNPVFISTSPEQVSVRRVMPWRRLANI
jgi:transformation/transcription domain-associated protein